jgi:hypothetical protein
VPLNGVLRTAMQLIFPYSTGSHVYQDWSTTQRTSSQLDKTVGSIGVNMGHRPCEILSTPCRIHALTHWSLSERKWGCNSILERCS